MMQIRGGRQWDEAGATPEEKINNLILDGLYGNQKEIDGSHGTPGYLDIINGEQRIDWTPQIDHKQIWAGNPFGAARFYNSGDAVNTDLTVLPNPPAGEPEYACRFASRLVGWRRPDQIL